MLDQLANGRLDLSLSRGSSGEYVENDPDKSRDMLNEAVDVILMGLSTGQVDFHGRHYIYNQAFTRLGPGSDRTRHSGIRRPMSSRSRGRRRTGSARRFPCG